MPHLNIDKSQLQQVLPACLGVPRWIDEVVAGAPYTSVDELIVAAELAATPLSAAEIDQAMSHHPRIGEKPVGEGAAQTFSRREQASLGADDAELGRAISEGNREYEERFGRVFLIRAAGRSRIEILAELRRRMLLDDEVELAIVGQQLGEIAVLRLRAVLETAAGETAGREIKENR